MATFNYRGYPKTKQFLQSELYKIPVSKPKVFEHFKTYSLFRSSNAKKVLQTGFTPSIKVRPLPAKYGFTPPTADEIWLAQRFVEELEVVLDENTVFGVFNYYTVKDNALLLLEATTLHELVHWCRRKVNGYRPGIRAQSYEEAVAQEFEQQAYGRVNTVENLGLGPYMQRTAPLQRKMGELVHPAL